MGQVVAKYLIFFACVDVDRKEDDCQQNAGKQRCSGKSNWLTTLVRAKNLHMRLNN